LKGGVPQSTTLFVEFLPAKHRAKCLVLGNIFWSTGTCFEVLLAILVMPTLGWRWLLGLSSLPLLIFFVFCYWIPESARFHLASGRPEEAARILAKISSDNKRPLPEGRLGLVKVKKKKKP
jgi:MFS family permease